MAHGIPRAARRAQQIVIMNYERRISVKDYAVDFLFNGSGKFRYLYVSASVSDRGWEIGNGNYLILESELSRTFDISLYYSS